MEAEHSYREICRCYTAGFGHGGMQVASRCWKKKGNTFSLMCKIKLIQ